MILLHRYILKQFFIYIIMVAAALVAIYQLIDFFEKIDNFNDHGIAIHIALKFFFLNTPFILDLFEPILILLAGIITLGILNNSNELRALKACGIPQMRILKPIIAGAVLVSVLFLILAQWLLPKTISATNAIWYEKVQGKVPLGIYREGRYYYQGKEGFYSFEWPETKTFSFHNFSYSRWNREFHLQFMLSADNCEWSEKGWIFHNGQIQTRQENGSYAYKIFSDFTMNLPEKPEQFFVPEYRSAELSLTGLYHDAHIQKSTEETTTAWANFFGRLSYILLGLPLLFLGLPVLLLSFQKWGRDLAIAIPASCILAFIAWGIWGALQSLAKAGYFPPLLAASVVHVIFSATGIFLLYLQDR